MADSVAEQIVVAIQARVETITVGAGYNTTPTVLRNRPGLDPPADTLPAVIVREQQESSQRQGIGGRVFNELRVVLECYSGSALSPLVADVKKAVFLQSGTNLSGLAHDVLYEGWRRVNDDIGAAVVAAEVELTVQYNEPYGDPYTAL